LVARKGPIKEWHFGHEQGQERPDCVAGARNLLRRLTAEELLAAPWRVAPLSAPHPSPGRPPLEWSDEPAGAIRLAQASGPHTPAAWVPLRRSGEAAIYITIGSESPPSASAASLLAVVPLPEAASVRSESDARGFIRETMRLRWLHVPELEGMLVRARHEEAERQRHAAEAYRRSVEEQRAKAGRRWAAIRAGMPQANTGWFGAPAARSPSPLPAAAPPVPAAPPWAPGYDRSSSLQYRRLDDGTQWVLYPAAGEWRLAQVPEPVDGWDEAFPPTHAQAGVGSWLRVTNMDKLLSWFHAHTRRSVIDSDPAVIERAFTHADASDDGS